MHIMENNIWWTGVVEDRNDPEKLGRCRVRIFGYHDKDTNLLPTKDLPWAIPIQPITSAATSGIGSTPVGIVTGTWVVGFFLDSDESQQPVILGTLAGKPAANQDTLDKITQLKEQNNYLRDSKDQILYNNSGQAIPLASTMTNEYDKLSQFTESETKFLFNIIGNKLSGGEFDKIGNNGELGAYQLPVSSLINLGYVRRPTGGLVDTQSADNSSGWTGLNGADSKEIFLNTARIQEKAMLDYTVNNYITLTRLGKINDRTERDIVAGLLMSAHVMGTKNSDKLDKKTLDGIKAREYFIAGNQAFRGDTFNFEIDLSEEENNLPENLDAAAASALNNEELSKIQGFQDPNKQYPKYEYANLSDVNKLAVGDVSHLAFKVKENNKVENISLARTSQTWDEPASAYSAVYPHNQVIETEAGHVVEFDSTPNAERIHIFHKTGTYIEIDVNGTMVKKVVGDNYTILDRNDFVYVKGAKTLTVEGKTSILVKDNASIQVEGDLSVTGHGDTLVQSAGNIGVVSDTAVITAKTGIDMVTDGTFKLQAKNIIMHAKGGSFGIKADQDLSLQSGPGSTLSVKGGLALLLDATVIKSKMGGTAIGPLGLAAVPVPERKTPDKTQIPVLQRTIVREEIFLFDSDEEGADDYKQSQISEGKINDNIQTTIDFIAPASGRSGPVIAPIAVDSSEVNNFTTFPRSFRLSKYFTLRNVLVGNRGTALVAQKGLTEAQIVSNLKTLAVNVLDPIREKYRDMIITSGFRIGPENSEHNIGSAVDLMFRKTDFQQYKDIADWISQNVPFRQLLLEYRFNNSSNTLEATWIHVSLLLSGNSIVKSTRYSTATFKNHTPFAKNKFINLA